MKKKLVEFTLLELLIVIAIIMILAGLLLPTLKKAKEMGKRSICANNQKQISMAVFYYSQDYNGWIVPFQITSGDWTSYWNYLIEDYIPQINVFMCPTSKTPWPPSWHWKGHNYMNYGYNRYGLSSNITSWKKMQSISTPSIRILIADRFEEGTGEGYTPQIIKTGVYMISNRHSGGGILTFLDSHSTWTPIADIQDEWWGW
jgi:Tfp pilus assembly protein PilE